jgi:POT family proton-dependent oligopeptide transporter
MGASTDSGTAAPAAEVPKGHPVGLRTLFFTEMWERLSYYGMRALLVLFMTDAVRGMGLTTKVAGSIYGLYTGSVYLAALPGGWVADRLLGAQRAVWYGGMIIAAGHFTLAIPGPRTFFLGLLLVVIGTGLLKPNVSAMVGALYPEGGARRDAGFSIYYMGINLGAFIGPFICGTLGEKVNWHYGFGAAGVGMVLGLIQYRLTAKNLGGAGQHPGQAGGLSGAQKVVFIGAVSALVLVVVLGMAGVVHFDPEAIAKGATAVLVATAVVFFASVFIFGKLDRTERHRVIVIAILIGCAALFWAGFEQAGSSFNIFAKEYTERHLWSGYEYPASWLQSVGPIFVITLAPFMAWLWVRLAQRNLNPSTPLKFGIGLMLLAVGFLVLAGAAVLVARGQKVGPTWLISVYLIHTFAELCLSPVGLSSMTKLSPQRFVGQMMGAWFLASALGNVVAGRIAGEFDPNKVSEMPGHVMQMVILPASVGVVVILLSRPIRKLMEGVR